MLNFVIWLPFCFLAAILFFKILSKFFQTVHTNFHAKSGLCSSRNEQVMLTFEIWRPFCFLAVILFFKFLSKFVQTVHMNFHAKSGLCSSRNEQDMFILVFGSIPSRPLPCRASYDQPIYRAAPAKKWLSYGTWYERGRTSIYHLYSSDYTVQTSFLIFSKFGQKSKNPNKMNFRTSY